MNKKYFKPGLSIGVFLYSLLASFSSFGQGYRLEVTLQGVKDTSCVLGHYNYSSSSFVAKDTARADASGKMVFEGKEPLPGGLYLVLLPGNSKWAEVVISGTEPNFSMTADSSAIVQSMTVKGSKENEVFYNYQKRLSEVMKGLEKGAKSNPSDPQLVALRNNFTAYRDNLFKEHSDLLAVKFLKAAQSPEIPVAPKLPNGKEDSSYVFNYYKNHYWDNFDLNDARMLRTPLIQNKLDQYIKNLIVQVPDSIIKDADQLIAKTNNPDVRFFLVRQFAMEYENPKTVGTEGVFVHMAENYYLKGLVDVSDDAKRRLKERVDILKPLLVGKTFPALPVWTPAKKPFNVQDLKGDMTVVFFYSPSCGHCKESTPALVKFAETYKNVTVVAVAIENSESEWKEFIDKQQAASLHNGYDFSGTIDFRKKYDVLTTPTIYILDKDKKIIARKIPAEQLEDFYKFYQRKLAARG